MKKNVIAAVVEAPGAPFSMEQLSLGPVGADEILVRIEAVGLCHTDIVAQMGAFGYSGPVVLGHEGAGIIEAVGSSVEGFVPGDPVVISFRSCGGCGQCAARQPSYCETMPLLNYAGCRPDGSTTLTRGEKRIGSNFFGQSSFATHALTYVSNLVKLPDDFPFELAAPLGCGIQTGAGAILRSLDCTAGSALVIAGAGTVGLAAVMGAAIRGCAHILVVEPYASRRELALELGATHVIDPRAAADVAAAVRELVPEGTGYALDTTGRPEILAALLEGLAPRGILGIVGVAAPATALPGDVNGVMARGLRIVGIIEGDSDPACFIPELIAYQQDGRLPVERLVRTYPLAAINEAVQDQHDGKVVKVVLVPDAEMCALAGD